MPRPSAIARPIPLDAPVYNTLKDKGATLDRNTDHGMTSSVYFFDPDNIRIEFFCNNNASAEEGLAMMRAPDRVNKELVLG